MAAANTAATLNGLTKRVYGKIVNAVPNRDWILKNIKFDQAHKVGRNFEQPVTVTNENGYTYGGSGATAYTLNAAVAMGMVPAEVTPFDYTMRSQMSYGIASRAAAAGPRAFAKAITTIIKNAFDSCARRQATSVLYGSSVDGIGKVAVAAIVDNDSTSFYLVFAEDQWAPGVWYGSEGAILEAYDEGDAVETTGGSADLTVSQVNFRTRRVLVTGASALITQIETKNDTEALDIYFKGSHDNDMVGMDVVFQNLTGTIHGISATTYGLWAGNLFSASSEALTHARIMGFAAQLQNRGLEEDMIVLCNGFTWADLHQEQSSTRVYDESYEKEEASQGFKAIRYYSPSGWIRIVASPFVKAGEAFMFPLSVCHRIGSEDREWKIPGADGDAWHPIADAAGAEMRIHSDVTFFCDLPSRCAKIDDIVNNFGTTG